MDQIDDIGRVPYCLEYGRNRYSAETLKFNQAEDSHGASYPEDQMARVLCGPFQEIFEQADDEEERCFSYGKSHWSFYLAAAKCPASKHSHAKEQVEGRQKEGEREN